MVSKMWIYLHLVKKSILLRQEYLCYRFWHFTCWPNGFGDCCFDLVLLS
jgi:hypothetical protein